MYIYIYTVQNTYMQSIFRVKSFSRGFQIFQWVEKYLVVVTGGGVRYFGEGLRIFLVELRFFQEVLRLGGLRNFQEVLGNFEASCEISTGVEKFSGRVEKKD